MSREQELIDRTPSPTTVASLTADLVALGVESGGVVPGEVLMVHSSLAALGWVAGGAQAVVEALFAAVGPAGTLVMPTHSGQLTDPAGWEHPPVPDAWVDVIRAATPVFDPDLTPCREMGAIVDCFRHHRATVRSAHPVLSLAANGPCAAEIARDHALSPALGEGSPIARLYDLDAQVLLLGVGHANDTALHLAEYRATWPAKMETTEGVALMVDGERRWVSYTDLDLVADDFESIGEAFAATGGEQRGRVALAEARLCRVRAIVDFAVAWMTANRG